MRITTAMLFAGALLLGGPALAQDNAAAGNAVAAAPANDVAAMDANIDQSVPPAAPAAEAPPPESTSSNDQDSGRHGFPWGVLGVLGLLGLLGVRKVRS